MVKEDITHIISHTHWDREWYLPFQNFRFRLVKMIDRCLEILDKGVPFRFFNLDGQTIVIEDYLEIKPENRDKLKKYIQEGKIGIGPWYLQNSPWLQTAEGIIRNLQFGYRICSEYGVKPVDLGYIPDQFIIPPMYPQILQGFGIHHIAFQRALNDQYEKYGISSEFIFQSEDGSQVTAFHLKSGYGMAGFLPNDPIQALNQIVLARGSVESTPHSTHQILMFNGSDHTDPDENLPEVIDMWNEDEELVNDFGKAKHSSWDEFFKAFWSENPKLKIVKGELCGVKYHFAARGVYSNRMPIKQENFALHYLLEKYSEPFNALSWTFGNEYRTGFIRTSWKYLLQNQAHDSIWAASPDAIIDDMWTRFRWTRQIGDEVFRRSAHDIIIRINPKDLIPESKQKSKNGKKYYITVFNPSPWYRTDGIRGTISVEKADITKPLILRDCTGELIPAKFYPRNATGDDRLLYRTFVGSHGPLPLNLVDFVFLAPNIPPLGYETFSIQAEDDTILEEEFEETIVDGTKDILENDVIQVTIEKNGSISIKDKETNREYKNLNIYYDTGNRGCNYEYIPIKNDKPITTENCVCRTELIESCPAYAEIKIEIPWELPLTTNEDLSARSEEKTLFPITTYVRIYPKNNRRVDIKTEFINTAKWHQVRAVFPTGLNVQQEFVKSHFQVIERPVDTPWDFEGPYATEGVYPQHGFMGIYDPEKKQGLCILNKGLPSYETYRDEQKNVVIALNLFRAQGQWVVHLHLNPNISTPDAQWLNKKVVTEYSIVPMKENWLNSRIPKLSEEFISPLRYEEHWDVFRLERYSPKKDLPPIYSLLEILEGNIELSCVKKCEYDESLVIRVYNLTNKIEQVKLRSFLKIDKIEPINLNEEPLSNEDLKNIAPIDIKVDENNIRWIQRLSISPMIIKFELKPYKIITLKIYFT